MLAFFACLLACLLAYLLSRIGVTPLEDTNVGGPEAFTGLLDYLGCDVIGFIWLFGYLVMGLLAR